MKIRQGPSSQKQNKQTTTKHPASRSNEGDKHINISLQNPMITALRTQWEGATSPNLGFWTRFPIRDDSSAIWNLSKKGKGIPNRSVGCTSIGESLLEWMDYESLSGGLSGLFMKRTKCFLKKLFIVFRTLIPHFFCFWPIQQPHLTET